MIDKIKTILTITLIVILVFAIGFCLVKLIISALQKPTLITSENVQEYIKADNTVTGYASYYYYESCFKNFIEACDKEMYDGLYNIYIKDYKDDTDKEVIMNKLKSIKSMLTPKNMDDTIEYKLEKLYLVENNYITQVRINDNTFYMVFMETNSKERSYNFAFVM